MHKERNLTSLEICAGAGGQALGVEQAGFRHIGLVENDSHACATLRINRPSWNVIEKDLRQFDPDTDLEHVESVDLLAGGVPCTPYSVAGNQLGADDERDLVPVALQLVGRIRPKAIMFENVKELISLQKFKATRDEITLTLTDMGYSVVMQILDAQHFGVSQRRQRALIVALRKDIDATFHWPDRLWELPPTVGELLEESMAANGWAGASEWARLADDIAPTLVGGSKKHGGADLGPDRAKNAWARLSINGNSTAEEPPGPDFALTHGVGLKGRYGYPKLTVAQAALIQGFPPTWKFCGSRTVRYKQVGNAFPPPVARAVAGAIHLALSSSPAAGQHRSAPRLVEPRGHTETHTQQSKPVAS